MTKYKEKYFILLDKFLKATKEGFPKIDPEILKNIDFSKINSLFGF